MAFGMVLFSELAVGYEGSLFSSLGFTINFSFSIGK